MRCNADIDLALVSVPGDPEVRMGCLPGSTLPDELRQLGYDVRDLGDGGAHPGGGDRRAVYHERRWRIRGAGPRIDKAGCVDRDARRHRQGEAVRVQHSVSCPPAPTGSLVSKSSGFPDLFLWP